MSTLPDHAVAARARPVTTLLALGAGEGLKATVPLLASVLPRLAPEPVELIVVDPAFPNLAMAAEQARQLGLRVTTVVSLAEDAVAAGLGGDGPIVVQVDDLAVLGRVLAAPEAAHRPILALVFLLLPNKQLLGLRIVVVPGVDDATRAAAARVAARLALYTQLGGGDVLFGPKGLAAHKIARAVHRKWFRDFLELNLPKIAARLRPVTSPIEVTENGRRTMPLMAVFHDGGFVDPVVLSVETLASRGGNVQRGEDVVIAEATDDGVAFVFTRWRGLDGSVAVGKGASAGRSTLPAEGLATPTRIVVDRHNLVAITD